jgi:hypothetical protein
VGGLLAKLALQLLPRVLRLSEHMFVC